VKIHLQKQHPVIVDEIIEVPKISYEEEIIEKKIINQVIIPKYVEVPKIQVRQVEKYIDVEEEDIIEIPKIEYVEEIVERQVLLKNLNSRLTFWTL